MDASPRDRQWITCPGCQAPVDLAAEPPTHTADGSLQCLTCGTHFVLAPDPAESPSGDDAFCVLDYKSADAEGESAVPEEQQISSLKVRQLSALRRALFRSRSYYIIAAGALAVTAVQLVVLSVRQVADNGWSAKPIGYIFFAAAAFTGAGILLREILSINREIRQTALTEPDVPPDFSILGNGSQHWERLRDM